MHEEEDDATIYGVVINHEEQYAIWPADREPPPGWTLTGVRGPKTDCLAHIREVWTDMRPLSLRRRMSASNPQRSAREEPKGE